MMTLSNSQNSSQKQLASRSVTEKFSRTIVVLMTLIAFVFSSTRARADEKMRTTPAPTVTTTLPMNPVIVPIQKGWIAPFTGVLLNPPAVAQITVDAKNAKQECSIRVEAEVSKEKAFGDTRLEDKDGELKYAKETLGEQLKLKDAEIVRLRKDTIEKSGSTMWWGVGGFAGGVILTMTIVFLMSASSK